MNYLLRISRGFAARDGSTVKSNLDYITTAPPPNLTRLLHSTASYAGYNFRGTFFSLDFNVSNFFKLQKLSLAKISDNKVLAATHSHL